MWRDTFNLLVSVGTLILQIGLAAAIVARIFAPQGSFSRFLARFAVPGAFLIALAGMLLSLFYSEVAGYAPCLLCWYQRIALYPLVLLFGFSWLSGHSDQVAKRTGIALASIGALIAAYLYLATAFFPGALAGCAAAAVSCAKVYFNSFGFITIPLMAFTSFAAILFLLALAE